LGVFRIGERILQLPAGEEIRNPQMSISALIHKTKVDFRRINARYFAYYEQITNAVF
jgi:hypothetical protein